MIQLNNLYWRDFVNQPNPVASALIAKMRKSKPERPIAKLAALQLLTTLGLNPAQVQLISGFIDTYLRLNTEEKVLFEEQLARIEPKREEVMEIVTSWMEEGIERGLEQGRQQEAVSFTLRLLKRRFGVLTSQLQERIQALSVEELEDLGEELLDFTDIADLETWLGDR
ncbi:MAG TPA: DUF4351 domain-containing protein [Nostocaceae cyanobacterium]|nr:DUF4351 domain-containing protein [Nostocaceae cyanobacterium]